MTLPPLTPPSFLRSELDRIFLYLSHFLSLDSLDPSVPRPERPFYTDNDYLPLAILQNLVRLNGFAIDLLLLCLGFEIDLAFHNLARDYPSISPSFSLACQAFPEPCTSVLSSVHPLHYLELIEISTSLPIAFAPLRLSPRVLAFMLGESGCDEFLLSFCSSVPSYPSPDVLPSSHEKVVEQLVVSWSGLSHHLPPLLLTGGDLTANSLIAKEATQRLERNLLRLSAATIPHNLQELLKLKKRWEREALLSNFVLLLYCDEHFPSDSRSALSLALFVENLLTPVIISSSSPIPTLNRPLLRFAVPPLGYTEQRTIWSTQLGSFDSNPNGQIDRLASQFNLSASAIETACLQYKNQSQQAEESPNPNLLWDYCRNQARPRLDDLAQRLDSTATWSDLVLPEPQRLILEDIATHLKHRAKVYQDWGFSGKGSRGLGLCALFHGESGTGKTMAAEVLANHFRLDLYRIDLSAAVSKYVGETEKNLRRIFDAAESGGAILLFDEADAIFGKRTEVNDSRDRYANVEISYLLQRIEAFSGLAILTSNRKEDLDTAFARRIRFAVTFTFPDASCRSQIWQCIFPSQTPTQGLDYQKLGQLKIAGGNIRNIALNAAFLAAEAEEPVMMKHLLAGAHREYLKLKRLLSDEEIRGWVF